MLDDDALIESLCERVKIAPRSRVANFAKPETHPRATSEDVAKAESELGFAMPYLLRRMYMEVADGGFGPGYGIFSLRKGSAEPGQTESLIDVRNQLRRDPSFPPQLLAICDWGCAIWSCLDCRGPHGRLVTVDGENPFMMMDHDLRSWLSAWLAGVDLWNEMFEPGPAIKGTNPFTKQPIEMKGPGKAKGRPWP